MEATFEKVSTLLEGIEEFQAEKDFSRVSAQALGLYCEPASSDRHQHANRGNSSGHADLSAFYPRLSLFRAEERRLPTGPGVLFKLRRSTVSSQLNTLEKRGLIQRVAVPHDARLKKLVLTEKGVRIGDQVLQNLRQVNTLLIRGLNQEEVTDLTELLEKLEKNLSQTAL